ncbi:programmed cell death protein 2-like [Senna tora]|uniref:Programmed cell death protein 2-like n=1 Tax=Senna tora TaxID=362788 RepID=A0A834TYH5_9FABA|nr:programmed cell death protein 2-like [Senna tora]
MRTQFLTKTPGSALALPGIREGFAEKPKNKWSLYRQCFPSKAGGVPAWLDPLNIPSGRSHLCDICGEPLQFLLQVYAPTDKESTFHRMLFVFMCPSMKCLLRDQHEQWKRYPEKPSRSVKVYRCQLPCINPFYSSDSPKYNGSDKPVDSGVYWDNPYLLRGVIGIACAICGIDNLLLFVTGVVLGKEINSAVAADKCGIALRNTRYLGHKIACQQMKISSQTAILGPNYSGTTSLESNKNTSNTMWPEFEIIIDHESEYNTDAVETNALSNSLISRNRSDDGMNSLLENFQGGDDKKSWASFQERIAMAPEQVLRYYRNTNAKPIWPVSSGRPSKTDIPKCEYCGGPLCCEFQILPQLLYFFGVDNEADSLDWASIVVYTCEASCEASVAYKNEYAWVQLYSPSTI